jgi:putative transcriptional regulator
MRLRALATAVLLLAAAPAFAGLEDDAEPLLLVAHPRMDDENFARTVVAVGFPQDGGAMGVILNRPSGLSLGELLGDELPPLRGRADPVGLGGPVTPDGMLFVFRAAEHPVRALPLVADWYLSGDGTLFDRLSSETPATPPRARWFVGYAGWGEGQLDKEVARGDWLVLPLDQAVLSDLEADTLWERMLVRTRARSAALHATRVLYIEPSPRRNADGSSPCAPPLAAACSRAASPSPPSPSR